MVKLNTDLKVAALLELTQTETIRMANVENPLRLDMTRSEKYIRAA